VHNTSPSTFKVNIFSEVLRITLARRERCFIQIGARCGHCSYCEVVICAAAVTAENRIVAIGPQLSMGKRCSFISPPAVSFDEALGCWGG